MLGRYIGMTLLMLGAAMLILPDETADGRPDAASEVPDAPGRDRGAAPMLASARGRPAAGAPDAPRTGAAPIPAQAAAPAHGDDTSASDGLSPSLEISTTRAEGPLETMDMSIFDGIPRAERMLPPRDSDAAIEAEVAAAPLPSLSQPGTVTDPLAITPETLALIAAAGVTGGATGADAASASAEPEAQTLFVSGSRVNVRAGPATSYSVIDSLGYGTAVELLADADGAWAEIRLPDARTGFMSRNFLAPSLPGD